MNEINMGNIFQDFPLDPNSNIKYFIEIFNNKKYLILKKKQNPNFKIESELFHYDPITKETNYLFYDFIFYHFIKINNLVIITASIGYGSNSILIIDENLNVIRKDFNFLFRLAGHDESLFYIRIRNEIKAFDLKLNEVNNLNFPMFQITVPSDQFYLKSKNDFTWYFEKRHDRYYLKTEHFCNEIGCVIVIHIYDDCGTWLKSIKSMGNFKINSKNVLIEMDNNLLKYYDSNGEPIKTVQMDLGRPKINKLKHAKMDFCIYENDKLYYFNAPNIYFE